MNNMTAAQAAQQSNRDNGGKYATKKVGEVEGVDLATEPKTVSDRLTFDPRDYKTPLDRLTAVGRVLNDRAILAEAAAHAREEHGADAYTMVISSEDPSDPDETLFEAHDIDGRFIGYTSVYSRMSGENSVSNSDILVEDSSTDVYSVPAAARIDVEKEASRLHDNIVSDGIRARTYDYTGMGPGDLESVLELAIDNGDVPGVENMSEVTEDQWVAIENELQGYEIPESAHERMWDDFSDQANDAIKRAFKA